ncbi:MAG: hypothetical protein A3C50_00990 [Candidatus Staskawiczbacteria bacterium RIFCSPHIGHO2_02_FULL_43_16]|uniref:Uncharacterized protein n=1 Tax=Candidatus Staskawiczbacteria bacterium RIFCSPHIGHO2_01_FULL_41_41 TaxID=1802203 RepID=A0A1G2HTE7_9BACT|nr:MAG: hypothetical protein A2822_00990 [Candidatus Staskawiczbacteria bacterium RIFCSPHIGHO2_01_FULL_41_41]OGZ68327.1 MAG: hypothetical protein A3C50_00990 [Candidatus Staskawiczbacteria bacterium RIFCSPHIGHO2_02_FULL_43_16]OGZ75118.1 MAG: hypothetical protein A3A12_00515 [Candidatus Staskawiczbacteria bacterium RIFCSPLOWO2_01_FULL_43_17b]
MLQDCVSANKIGINDPDSLKKLYIQAELFRAKQNKISLSMRDLVTLAVWDEAKVCEYINKLEKLGIIVKSGQDSTAEYSLAVGAWLSFSVGHP